MCDAMNIRHLMRTAIIALTIHVLIGASSDAAVVANFTFSPSNPAAGQPVQFTDTSTGNPTHWQWDFENPAGTDSTLQNPTWTFEAPGTYPVKLTAYIPPLDIDDVVINVVVRDPGELKFSMSSYEVDEEDGTALITVLRTGGSGGEVSVQCNTANGTAQAGQDYTAPPKTLIWTAGDTGNKTYTVNILPDSLSEDDETVSLSLTNPTGGATVGSPSTATLTIHDDPGKLSFTQSSYQVNENDGTASIAVRRTYGSGGEVSVQCNTANGTAKAGQDYTTTSETLTWTSGNTADKYCTIPIIDDSLEENNETINLSLSNFTGGADPGPPSSAILTIIDVEPGQMAFPTSSVQVDEDIGNFAIPVLRVGGSDGLVKVRCTTVSGGTATAGSDYTAIDIELTWTNGDIANKFCTLPIIDDTLVENDETVIVSLTNPSGGATLGTPSTGTVTIRDDDDHGDLSFTMSSYEVNESAGTASIAVRRTDGSAGAVSVRCNTADGTATAGQDYTDTEDTLTWADGDTANKLCTVPIIDDCAEEGNETIILTLTNFSGGADPGSPTTATLTIRDDDEAGQLSFSASSYEVEEDVGTASITVRRTGGSDCAVSVRCKTVSGGTATAGQDYTDTEVTLNWADGDTANKNCPIPIIDDTTEEDDETIKLSLSDFDGGADPGTPATATLTIRANDKHGYLSFTKPSYEVDEDVGTASIPVQRTDGSFGVVSVQCNTANGTAYAGQDYTTTTDTLTWADGDSAPKTCTIPITNDTIEEGNETINLSLTNFTGGAHEGSPITATLTILANDQRGYLSFTTSSYSVNENAGTASIAVRRTGGSFGAVGVDCSTANGTATAGQDYTDTEVTLTWAHGDTTNKFCTIPIIDDNTEEGNETIILSLANFTGGAHPGSPTNATLTILDDDEAGELSFTTSSYQVDENVGNASIAVRRDNGSDGAVSVQCKTVAGGTAQAGQDYTATTDTLTWADGDTANKTCTVPIIDSNAVELDETVNLSLSNFTNGAAPGSPSSATLTIVDDDIFEDDFESGETCLWSKTVPAGPILSFSMDSYTVDEDVGTASITVRRNDPCAATNVVEVTVKCVTADMTAKAGEDYGATEETLRWLPGDYGNKICQVPIYVNEEGEGAETFRVSLTGFTGGAFRVCRARPS